MLSRDKMLHISDHGGSVKLGVTKKKLQRKKPLKKKKKKKKKQKKNYVLLSHKGFAELSSAIFTIFDIRWC